MQKAPAASRAGIKEQERQELKFKKLGSRWDNGNGDQGPLHKGYQCMVQCSYAYSTLEWTEAILPAQPCSPSSQGLRWDWSLRSCPVCKEAGFSRCPLLPFVPLKQEKQNKGNFSSGLLWVAASQHFGPVLPLLGKVKR